MSPSAQRITVEWRALLDRSKRELGGARQSARWMPRLSCSGLVTPLHARARLGPEVKGKTSQLNIKGRRDIQSRLRPSTMMATLEVPLTANVSATELGTLLTKLDSVYLVSVLLKSGSPGSERGETAVTKDLKILSLEIGTPNFLELFGNPSYLATVASFVAIVLSATNISKALAETQKLEAETRKLDAETKRLESEAAHAERKPETAASIEEVAAEWAKAYSHGEMRKRELEGSLPPNIFRRCDDLLRRLPEDIAVAARIVASDRDIVFCEMPEKASAKAPYKHGIRGHTICAAQSKLRDRNRVELLDELVEYMAWMQTPPEKRTTASGLWFASGRLVEELGRDDLSALVKELEEVEANEP
jgi:hypothetical protein